MDAYCDTSQFYEDDEEDQSMMWMYSKYGTMKKRILNRSTDDIYEMANGVQINPWSSESQYRDKPVQSVRLV